MCVTTVVKLRCIRLLIGATDVAPACRESRAGPLPLGWMIRWCKGNTEGGQRFQENRRKGKLEETSRTR